MPMQYKGGNKVSGYPSAINRKQGAPMPGGNTQLGTSGGRAQIGGKANGGGSARIGQGGYGLKPGMPPKRAQPFNAARQKGLAVQLRARNAKSARIPGGSGNPGTYGGNASEY